MSWRCVLDQQEFKLGLLGCPGKFGRYLTCMGVQVIYNSWRVRK